MRIFFTLLLLLPGILSFSQVSVWPKAGANLAWTSYPSQLNVSIGSPSNFGFYGGVMFDIPITKNISIRPEITYSQLNISLNIQYYTANPNGSISHVTASRNEKRQYISLPVSLVRHIMIDKNDFQLTFGGYISQGLNGGNFDQQYTQDSNDGSGIHSEGHGVLIAGKVPQLTGVPVPTGTIIINAPIPLPYYNPLDIGLNVGFGYQIKKLLINTQLGIGLTNTEPHYDDSNLEATREGSRTSNRSVSLGVAYRIF